MRKCLLLVALLAMIAVPVLADTLHFDSVGGATGAVNGTTYYVYPYNISVNGGSPLEMMCDTFNGHTNVGDTWTAELHTFGDVGSGNTMFGDPSLYLAAAWLLNHGGNAADINIAVWGLFTDLNLTGNSLALHDAALAFATSGNAALNSILEANLRIYTPVRLDANGGLGVDQDKQEFLTMVPEPGTLMLFGSGLLSAVGVLRRRLRG
jgi:PEP-CTERM motif